MTTHPLALYLFVQMQRARRWPMQHESAARAPRTAAPPHAMLAFSYREAPAQVVVTRFHCSAFGIARSGISVTQLSMFPLPYKKVLRYRTRQNKGGISILASNTKRTRECRPHFAACGTPDRAIHMMAQVCWASR
jgi:hypothetical protein